MKSKKVIVITGGSRGIGAAIAQTAAEQGYAVCISYQNNDEQAEHTLKDIRENGGTASAIRGDLRKIESVANLFSAADEMGTLAVLVNNAAVTGERSKLCDLSPEMLSSVFELNVFAMFSCSKEAVLRMSKSRGGQGGAIINISSGASKSGSPNSHIHYAASKGAVDTLTVGLAKEVASESIRVNCIRPGLVETEIHASKTKEGLRQLLDMVPMRRFAHAQEIADAVMWLASDQASYTTGALLDVSGGL